MLQFLSILISLAGVLRKYYKVRTQYMVCPFHSSQVLIPSQDLCKLTEGFWFSTIFQLFFVQKNYTLLSMYPPSVFKLGPFIRTMQKKACHSFMMTILSWIKFYNSCLKKNLWQVYYVPFPVLFISELLQTHQIQP